MTYQIPAEKRDDKTVTINPHQLAAEMEGLTACQKGVLVKLLLHKWCDDMLPISTGELARMAGTSPQHMGQSRAKLDPILEVEFRA
jgi:hypothetical protein